MPAQFSTVLMPC